MARLPLSGGAYQAASVIASAQRSLNLFAEAMPQQQGEPAQWAYYPTPGLRQLGTLPQGPVRGIRQCTNGAIYAVAGHSVYLVDPTAWTGTWVGDVTVLRPYPVSMQDNGLTLVIVDGTATGGWTIDLASNTFAAITDPNFSGADRVDYLDTFLTFNKPNTPQLYWSLSLSAGFDPLGQDFANKETFSDLLVTQVVAKREIWLLGERTTEIWADVGQTDITGSQFQPIQSVFVDHGCRAKYSVATYDNAVYWLSNDRAGGGIVISGAGYATKRVSTFAIEHEFTTYPMIEDAIGFCYSLAGHVFYVITFPHADKTWAYDITTGEWHEWLWIDSDGVEHRHRANCAYNINGVVVVGDHEGGQLYAVERDALSDAGQPIKRQRSFPHSIADAKRIYYREFIADMESGNANGPPVTTTQLLLNSTFTAADGTLLQAYDNPGDVNATFSLISGSAVIEADKLTGPSGGGSGEYTTASTLPSADYTAQFQVIPSAYTSVPTGDVYIIGRYSGAGTGYRAQVSGDGTQYQLKLDVEAAGPSTTLAMGTLSSGFYAVSLVLAGESVSLAVQRSQDSRWLNSGGTWAVTQAVAITMTDATYSAIGTVIVGGSW